MNDRYDVSIIGCGWLGFPLAKYWIAKGLQVAGTTTSADKLPLLKGAGIAAYLVQLNGAGANDLPETITDAETIVIAIPPRRKQHPPEDYLRQMLFLSDKIRRDEAQQIIFISSTSAYPDANGVVDETAAVDENSLMVKAEQVFAGKQTAIVRFGGLIGPGRHPGRFFNGKSGIPNGRAPVNLIHLDDCIGILDFIRQKKLSGIFNGVAPVHPHKAAFYARASHNFNAGAEPAFKDELCEWKEVMPENMLKNGFRFRHPDLIAALQKDIW